MKKVSALLRNVLLAAAVASLAFAANPQTAQADGCTQLILDGSVCTACQVGCCWSIGCSDGSGNGGCNLC